MSRHSWTLPWTRRSYLDTTDAGAPAGSRRVGVRSGFAEARRAPIVAADTEPRNLNPAMVASNGVFFVASKVIEPLAEMVRGRRPPAAAGDRLGGLRRR